ncbi:MAG: glycosyltransferase XagB, partial [Actinomycetota bacterium]|nr:glycosyltransferase XagB [Actinomycetota bacterium]
MTRTTATLSISLADSEHALDQAINGLRNEDPGRSASVAIVGWQRAVIWTSLAIAIGLGIWRPMQTAVALIGLCTLGYVLTMIDRVQIFRQGLAYRAIVITDQEARAIPDDELPPYTILVPAYNEPEVVGDLLAAMTQLE